MKSHTRAKSLTEHLEKAVAQYPRGATLGTLDLIADVSFSGASLRFCCYLSAWSSGAGAFYYSERGGLFCTHGYQAAGALFLPFHDVAILLCDKQRGVLLRRSQGDRCPQWGTRTWLNVSFLYSARATDILALAEFHSHSLSRMPAHQWCGGK